MSTIGLIIIGDEILSGKRQDKHLPKLIELLDERGLALGWARYVGDRRDHITAVLKDAFASGEVVFSCGGIGATPDDHTRQCAAAALGVPLRLHPGAAALIDQRMQALAQAQGRRHEPDHPEHQQRLQMGVFPEGATLIANPYNQIPGFSVGDVHFVPGFPVMAHPMMAAVLDERYAHLHGAQRRVERSVIVLGAMEATLTPLMEDIEARFDGVKVFSLPSVDHPQWGRHIELGVKGDAQASAAAFAALMQGLAAMGVALGPELVR